MTLICIGRCHVTDAALGKSATEGAAIKARNIAGVDYGRTRTDTAARIRVFFADVLALNPTAFRPRLRNVPDLDFAGEPRPDHSHPYPHWPDHLRERRVRKVVHLRRAEEPAGEGGEVECGEEGSGTYRR